MVHVFREKLYLCRHRAFQEHGESPTHRKLKVKVKLSKLKVFFKFSQKPNFQIKNILDNLSTVFYKHYYINTKFQRQRNYYQGQIIIDY